MESETVTERLKKYAIGGRLRRLRLAKSMGLVELSRHTGLSPALLSKLERGVMHPTLPTLLRIAMVFSVDLDYFFRPQPAPLLAIVRKQERLRFPASPDVKKAAYYFESLNFPAAERVLDCYLAEFEAVEGAASPLHHHRGIEFLYVSSGKVELRFEASVHELAAGDAAYFDAVAPHGYRRIGSRRTVALVVIAGR
jgi:transcriptional regulator with XRE-family HTH domain